MKLSKRQWKWRSEIAPIFEKYYWMGFGLGVGFFSAEIVVSGIQVIIRDAVSVLV